STLPSTGPRTCRPKAKRPWLTKSRKRRASEKPRLNKRVDWQNLNGFWLAAGRRPHQINKSDSQEAVMASPVGINHVVLNVRDMEASHKFWTEIVGLKQVGELHPRAEMGKTPKMQFYSGDHDGKFTHHDVALVENPNLPPPSEWGLFDKPVAINHVA